MGLRLRRRRRPPEPPPLHSDGRLRDNDVVPNNDGHRRYVDILRDAAREPTMALPIITLGERMRRSGRRFRRDR